MELDNQSEAQKEAIQPDEVVVTGAETTEAKPQAEASEEQEVYVEDSSDDQSTSHKAEMSKEQSYAAFQKKKKQSAKRKEELEAGAVREQQLKDELEQAKAKISDMTKIEPPTLDECGWDEEVFREKTQEYLAKSNPNQPKQSQVSDIDDQAEFYLYEKEQALTKLVPDYEDAKSTVLQSLTSNGINAEQGMKYLSNVARQKGIDIAKVVMAMKVRPHILNDILKAGSNDFKVADILEEAANKVKTREKKKIDSKPEPEINNSGPIDNSSAATDKLRKAWMENPNTANYKRYQESKTKK